MEFEMNDAEVERLVKEAMRREALGDGDVIPDGGSVRVGVVAMDSNFGGEPDDYDRPHREMADARAKCDEAYEAKCAADEQAWRTPGPALDVTTLHPPTDLPPAAQSAEEAWLEMRRRDEQAWKP
jgi:hypothetical protein